MRRALGTWDFSGLSVPLCHDYAAGSMATLKHVNEDIVQGRRGVAESWHKLGDSEPQVYSVEKGKREAVEDMPTYAQKAFAERGQVSMIQL